MTLSAGMFWVFLDTIKNHVVHICIAQACGCVCWSPSSSKDSACIAAGYSDGTLRIFQLATREMEMKLHPHQVAVMTIQYSANGKSGNMSLVCRLSYTTSFILTNRIQYVFLK